jgi:HAD superfamily hydrolase (TIGR01509 family)
MVQAVPIVRGRNLMAQPRRNDNCRIRAVVFDMDGVMFNTEDIYDLVGKQVLWRRGLAFTRDLKMRMMGLPGPRAFQEMKEFHRLEDSIVDLQNESDELFAQLLPEKVQLMPGMIALLLEIESRDLPAAVATSSRRKFAEISLNKFQLWSRFEFILTCEDIVHGKPHPEIYLKAAANFGIEPSEMLVLEDSVNGSRAAAAAGAVTAAIPESCSHGACFDHVDLVVDRLDSPDLLRVLDGPLGDNR